MKRKVLAMLVPALLVAGAANAAEIYNKNGNKVELYGKMVGERILTDRESGEKGDNSQDTSYARVGVKGETQINPELTGYGQFELDLEASNRHNPDQTRLAYAGLSYKDFGSFDYGRNVGVAYDAEAFTDMFVEWGGDSWAGTDLFMTNRTNGVATYRNTDFFGMVEGVWVHHILQFLFSFKIYSTGVISASALWGLLLLYSTRYSASFWLNSARSSKSKISLNSINCSLNVRLKRSQIAFIFGV